MRPSDFPPLSAWPAEVLPDEPAHGWFQRLAEANSAYSASKLAVLLALNGRNLDPAELLDFCLKFPAKNIMALTSNTPILSDHRVVLRGQVFNPVTDFSVRRPRVCPRCIGESRHHRNWFDLQIIGGCPIHGVLLTGGPENDRLSWWHPRIGVTPSGLDLAEADPLEPTIFAWEEYVLGRLGVLMPQDIPLLDAAPMDEVARVAVLLSAAECTAGKSTRRLDDRAALAGSGFAALMHGPDHLERVLRQLVNEGKGGEGPRSRGLRHLAARVPALQGGSLCKTVRSVFARALEMEATLGRRVSSAYVRSDVDVLDMKQFSKTIGLSPSKTRRLAQRLEVIGPSIGRNETYRFTSTAQQAIRSALGQAITREEVASRLGLAPKDMPSLIKAGLLVPLIRLGHPGPGGDRFLVGDPERLLSMVVASEPAGQSVREIGFRNYCDASGRTPGDVAVSVLAGDMPVVARGGGGFTTCVLGVPLRAVPTGSLRRRRAKAQNGTSYAAAAAAIGADPNAVGPLVAAGHLVGLPGAPGRLKGVCPEDLKRFAAEYVPARAFIESTGLTPTEIHGRIKQARVAWLSGPGLDRYRFVRRATVASVLGWGAGSDESALARMFRSQLRGQFRASGSQNQVVAGSSDTIRLRSADGKLTASVIIEPVSGTAELCIPVSRASTPKRFAALEGRLAELRSQWPSMEVFCDACGGGLTLSQTCILAGLSDSGVRTVAEEMDGLFVLVRRFFDTQTANRPDSLSRTPNRRVAS